MNTTDDAIPDDGASSTPRVPLACFHCRQKRIRCSGTKPVCTACDKASVDCEWPAGRQRKRTRREMELARAAEQTKATDKTAGKAAVCSAASASTDAEGVDFDVFADLLADTSPQTLLNTLNATAYLSGESSSDGPLELFYYRLSGSTAINPGIHRISLKLARKGNAAGGGARPSPSVVGDAATGDAVTGKRSETVQDTDLFDNANLPLRHVWETMLDRFLTNIGALFPSLSRQRMSERYESGTMSAFLANCICALGARFGSPHLVNAFIAKAEELIIPLLRLPAHDVCTGLLFLAWASYGQGSDAALWQYAGMAIRMATDLGIHENSGIYESSAHVVRTRLLLWSLFITDTVLAFATGRATTMDPESIDVSLPEDTDFFPDPARDTSAYPAEVVQPVPFVYLARLMVIMSKVANALNSRQPRPLETLQNDLLEFYATLPTTLQWSADNFKVQQARGHGSTFLTLHLWVHAVLALMYHPDLLKPGTIDVRLASINARQICECMVFADLVDHTSYTASPFLVQPLYIGAMALLHEMNAANDNPGSMFLGTIARQNLSTLMRALSRMHEYWGGAAYVSSVLEERSGLPTPASKSAAFISLPDRGLLKRFEADPAHPANIAPPTNTSLADSIARNTPVFIADLLNSYSVEGMSFAPADTFDLEHLLGMP